MSPPFQLPEVDCVVVNRDGGDSLFAALRSLDAQTAIDLSIVVVDNASSPAERERLAREAPAVRVIPFTRNLGFAGAANEGIARTRAPFVLLLNNDATLAPDYVARLAARLALDERLAGVQGLVLTADGTRIDSAGLDWNSRREAVPLLGGAAPSSAPSGVFEVSGVSATAALYRRDALADVAAPAEVFEPSFFAYYEDVDLSLRLARAGWRFACDPAALARHEGSRTGSRTPWKRAVWVAKNRWRTLFRNFEPRLVRREVGSLLRADLAHARSLGWRAPLLLLAVWSGLAFSARAARAGAGGARPLADWPRTAGAAGNQGSPAGRNRLAR
ncbi:MAG: glycosyltransferase family 2 protein [Acidobacteriota bacterium]